MKYRHFWFTFIIAIALVIMLGCISKEKTEVRSEVKSIEGPEQHFKDAHDSFLEQKWRDAADSIRDGAKYVQREAGQATEEGKKLLESSSDDLNRLADEVQKGTVKSIDQLNEAFAKTYQALSKNQQIKATKSWAKEQYAQTGDALKNASDDLEKSASWANEKLAENSKTVIDTSRQVAEKLKAETGWLASEVGDGLEALGKEVDNFGEKLRESNDKKINR